MQLFAGFTDDKPVVIGLSENITSVDKFFTCYSWWTLDGF